jgi:hypothetical protein
VKISIHKQTYADGRAYRYQICDELEHACYVAEPTGRLLPDPTRLVEFFDPGGDPVGRLQPLAATPWRRQTDYQVFAGEDEEPYALIQERWRLVDRLLLRLPRYDLRLGDDRYVAWGSRYGGRFYEITAAPQAEEPGSEEPWRRQAKVGHVERPASGPSYVVQVGAPPLVQSPLVLASLVILADEELYA